MARRAPGSRRRIASYGVDPALCGIAGPGFGQVSLLHTGLRVPTAPTGLVAGNLCTAYLFQAATLRLGRHQKVRVTGIGQLHNIGQNTSDGPPAFPLVQTVRSPSWHFCDVPPNLWALRMVRNPPKPQYNNLNTDSFAYRWSDTPALVYETASFLPADLNWNGNPDNYVALTQYQAPFAGLIPGEPVGNLGSFRSLDFPWQDAGRKALEPIIVEGPGALVLYVQAYQTNPSGRPAVTLPTAMEWQATGMPEDAALASFSSFLTWDIGAWIEYERTSFDAEPQMARVA